jgi:prevent-host-death family protein
MLSMERIGVRQLNQQTSRMIELVRQGHVIEVTDRGRPVARLVPVAPGQTLLDRLVGEGRALAPTSGGPLPIPPPLGDPTANAAEAVAKARDDERW